MLKRFGLTVVACGLMLGMACFADAAVVTSKTTTHATPHRTTVRNHRPFVRRGVHKTHVRKVSHNTVNATTTNVVAGRYHRARMGVRHHRFWMS